MRNNADMTIGKGISILAIGNSISHGIMFLGVIFLSRVYSPEDFGIYALIYGSVTILSAVSSFRYEMTILIPKYTNKAQLALQVSSIAAIGSGTLSLLVVGCLITFSLLEAYWLLLPITAFFSSIIKIGSFLQNRGKQYIRIVGIQVARSFLFILTAFLAFHFSIVENGLVLGMAVSYVIPGIWLLAIDFKRAKAYKSSITIRRCIFWIKRHNKFVYFTTPAVFISSLASQAPVFLLTYFVGSSITGYYSMVQRIVMAPVKLISTAVNRVYMQTITSRRNLGKKIYPFTMGMIKKFILPSVLIALIMVFLFEFKTLELVFGNQWVEIDALAMVMIPAFIISFIAKSISGFAVLGKNSIGLYFQIILLTLVSFSVILSANISGEAIMIFSSISIAFSICFLGQLLSLLQITKKIDESNRVKI